MHETDRRPTSGEQAELPTADLPTADLANADLPSTDLTDADLPAAEVWAAEHGTTADGPGERTDAPDVAAVAPVESPEPGAIADEGSAAAGSADDRSADDAEPQVSEAPAPVTEHSADEAGGVDAAATDADAADVEASELRTDGPESDEPVRPDPALAESAQAESAQAEPAQAGSEQAEPAQSGADQAGSEQAEPAQSGADQAGSEQPGADQAGSEQPEAEHSEAAPADASPVANASAEEASPRASSRSRRATRPTSAPRHDEPGGREPLDVMAELGQASRAARPETAGAPVASAALDRIIFAAPAASATSDAPTTDARAAEPRVETPASPPAPVAVSPEDPGPRLPVTALLFQAPDLTSTAGRSRRAQAPAGPPSEGEADDARREPRAGTRGRRRQRPDEAAESARTEAGQGGPERGAAEAEPTKPEQGAVDTPAADTTHTEPSDIEVTTGAEGTGTEPSETEASDTEPTGAEVDTEAGDESSGPNGGPRRRRRRGGRGRRGRAGGAGDAGADDAGEDGADEDGPGHADDQGGEQAADEPRSEQEAAQPPARRRSRGGRAGAGRGAAATDEADDAGAQPQDEAESEDEGAADEPGGSSRRRRRRRRGSRTTEATDAGMPESRADEVTALKGSTRLEAKRQRRRTGRDAGRRRTVVTEAEFLARRESVERSMVVRERGGRTQIAVLEDGVLVEHFVARRTQTSMVGNVYLGRVQNVLPSMEAAFVDVGKGRNAVLYAGEVNWDAAGMEGQPRRIEQALSSGDAVMVQVTKDPIGHKGARLTSQITLAGRYLVLVPSGAMTGISRKLPDTERSRLKRLLRDIVPEGAGVIVRTAAEGASEEELRLDVARLQVQWAEIERKAKSASAPTLLHGEPDLAIRVVRDVFNEDFGSVTISGSEAWDAVAGYIESIAPDLAPRLHRWTSEEDVFAAHRIDEQILKALDRKVWLPSGGSLVIDRTEAMTVVDVNTGKFTGSGGTLEETVTRNNLEAAEEIVRQLRLRDIGGIIVIDFIDMVLESNRDLVLRRLVECLGRDRTRHQVAEVTSLGLVQMTRKRVGQGLLEAFSEPCEACSGRGYVVHTEPIEKNGRPSETSAEEQTSRSSRGRRGRRATDAAETAPPTRPAAEPAPEDAAARAAVRATLATIAAAAAHAHEEHHEAAADARVRGGGAALVLEDADDDENVIDFDSLRFSRDLDDIRLPEPRGGEPVADQPGAEQPAAGEPVDDRPAADRPADDRPGAEQPAAGEPVGQPAGDRPPDDQAADDQAADDQAADDRPADDQTAGDQAADDAEAGGTPDPHGGGQG